MPRIVVISFETDRRGLPIAQTVRQRVSSGIMLGSLAQFTPERARHKAARECRKELARR